MTESKDDAHQLASLFEQAEMGGMPQVFDTESEVSSALGAGLDHFAIVSVWWD